MSVEVHTKRRAQHTNGMRVGMLEEGDGSKGQRGAEGKGSDLHLERWRGSYSVWMRGVVVSKDC